MYNSLKGLLTQKSAGRVCVETGGVEYELDTSYATVSRLPAAGSAVRIFTYLHHREDILRLYGFADEEERALFFDLIKVDGIGPKQALRILSGTSVESFSLILEAGDVDSLKRIPGLGVKTAQKIILALKGKLSLKESGTNEAGSELSAALADMGFDGKKAGIVVKKLLDEYREQGLQGEALEKEVFRQAIVQLSG